MLKCSSKENQVILNVYYKNKFIMISKHPIVENAYISIDQEDLK